MYGTEKSSPPTTGRELDGPCLVDDLLEISVVEVLFRALACAEARQIGRAHV